MWRKEIHMSNEKNHWHRIFINKTDSRGFPEDESLVFDSSGKPIGNVIRVFTNGEDGYAPTAYLAFFKGSARYVYPGFLNEDNEFVPFCTEKVYACSCCRHKSENCRFGNRYVEYAYWS